MCFSGNLHAGRSLFDVAMELVEKGWELQRNGEKVTQATLGYKTAKGIPSKYRSSVPMDMLQEAIGHNKLARPHPEVSPVRPSPRARTRCDVSVSAEDLGVLSQEMPQLLFDARRSEDMLQGLLSQENREHARDSILAADKIANLEAMLEQERATSTSTSPRR